MLLSLEYCSFFFSLAQGWRDLFLVPTYCPSPVAVLGVPLVTMSTSLAVLSSVGKLFVLPSVFLQEEWFVGGIWFCGEEFSLPILPS